MFPMIVSLVVSIWVAPALSALAIDWQNFTAKGNAAGAVPDAQLLAPSSKPADQNDANASPFAPLQYSDTCPAAADAVCRIPSN